MVTVAVLSRQGERSLTPHDTRRLAAAADVTYHLLAEAPEHTEVVRLLRGVEILAATNKCLPRLDAPLLDALPTLTGIVLYATGYDHVDVDLLESRGVGLSVLPDYATNAVAEHALGMVFSLATRSHLAHDRCRGLVGAQTSLRGIELAGRTMGVIGVGRIGTRVAQLGRALGMWVVGHDTSPRAAVEASAAGIPVAGLDRVIGDSDVVVLCASHAFGAAPLIGATQLQRMRPDALLVNVARAALVDTRAVAAAVRGGGLRGYAVDDEVISPDRDGDLLTQGRILQTGHSAWWRDEVLDRGRQMWGEHVLAAVRGRPLDVVTWPTGNRAFSSSLEAELPA